MQHRKPRAPLYNTTPMNSKKSFGNVISSDHNEFFAGTVTDSVGGMGNDIWDFFKPVVSQVTAQTQNQLTQAGTNLINNQLANNPALQATATDSIGDTIKAAILKNKWYIIGGLVLLAGTVVMLTRVSSKK